MPYVKQERRPALDRVVEELVRLEISNDEITDILRIISGQMWLVNMDSYMSLFNIIKEIEVKPNGDLNYILFKYARYHIKPSYNNYKRYLGAIQRAVDWLKLNKYAYEYSYEYAEAIAEIRRRILAKYEDEKIIENGDV